jgi:integrase
MSKKTHWERTSVQNLLRHGTNGRYYGRWTVGGKQKWVGLKTTVFTVAKLKLNDESRKIEKLRGSKAALGTAKGTVGDLMAVYEERVKGNEDLKPNSKKARLSGVTKLRRTWPELPSLKPAQVTPAAVAEWVAAFKAGKGASFTPPGAKKAISGNSAASVNRAVDTLRKIMGIAVTSGLVHSNPVTETAPDGETRTKKRVEKKKLELPSAANTQRIFTAIEASKLPGGWGPEIADFCRFLFFTGCRKSEVSTVVWGRVNWEKKQLAVNGTKTDAAVRDVPLFAATEQLLRKVLERRKGIGCAPEDPIFRISECQRSIDRACKTLGIPRITHHDLRHLFATNCVEAGVDYATIASWLGHSDGGVLVMRTYGHVRKDHSNAMAAKMDFGGAK